MDSETERAQAAELAEQNATRNGKRQIKRDYLRFIAVIGPAALVGVVQRLESTLTGIVRVQASHLVRGAQTLVAMAHAHVVSPLCIQFLRTRHKLLRPCLV